MEAMHAAIAYGKPCGENKVGVACRRGCGMSKESVVNERIYTSLVKVKVNFLNINF